ncbi:MAG: Fic family protein [Bifidobacteriaceae bacterium]|nr:Fic family protein [Bifidobacteriaceae bacterium]
MADDRPRFRVRPDQYSPLTRPAGPLPTPPATAATGDVERALWRFEASFDEHVYSAALLEGNTYTLPEVRTLIDGYTVGGHTRLETAQVEDIVAAHRLVHRLVRDGEFELSKDVSDRVNAAIAAHETLEPGVFRNTGAVRSQAATVQIPGRGVVRGADPGDDGSAMVALCERILEECRGLADPVEGAAHYFCQAILAQPYLDGNKRTAKLVASGHLLTHGIDAILVPAKDRAAYNDLLGDLFWTRDENPLTAYLRTLVA